MSMPTSAEAGPKASTTHMKIYFCDICNESIPLKDINSNRISIEDGKIFCPQCAPKKAKRREVPLSVVASVALAFLGIIVLAVGGVVAQQDLQDELRGLRNSSARVSEGLALQGKELTRTREQLAEVGKELGTVRQQLLDLEGRLERRILDLERTEGLHHQEQGAAFKSEINVLALELKPPLARLEEAHAALKDRMAGLEIDTQSLGDRLRDLSTPGSGAPKGGEIRPMPGDSTKPTAKVDPKSEEATEVAGLIGRLADPEPGVRFSTIVELSHYRGDRVVSAVEKMLSDPEDFVRKTAVQALLRLNATRSIPQLITALRDKDYFVRSAARDALRSLSGTQFAFDPDGTAAERERKAKEWDKWWEANRERILAKGG